MGIDRASVVCIRTIGFVKGEILFPSQCAWCCGANQQGPDGPTGLKMFDYV